MFDACIYEKLKYCKVPYGLHSKSRKGIFFV